MTEIEDIYSLIAAYQKSPERERRIVAAILGNLNGRRGIKWALQDHEIDPETMQELGETLAKLVRDTP
jgi:hypothetical protein